MLKYSIKVNEKNIKREEMSWGEKFLSQDLSYISGVTSPSYHLEKYSIMPSTNSIVSSDSTLRINSTNVYRNGYCILRNKKYDIKTLRVCMHNGNVMEYKDVKYIEYNGKYYYGVFDEKTGGYKFVIDSILKYEEENETVSEGSLTAFETSGNSVCFDTIFWIENGTITIDGTTYLYDANEKCIHLSDGSIVTDYTDISSCDRIYIKHYDTPKEVTKFILTKAFDSLLCNYSKITYCSYLYFINVNGNFYYIVEEKNTEGKTEFVCYIDDERYNLLIEYKKKDDESSDDEMEKYYAELTEENLNEYGIYNSYNYNSLKSLSLYVRVKCDGEYKYAKVEHQIINANSGDRVLLQITDDYSNIGVGDIIKVTLDEDARLKVFSQGNEESEEKEEFVIYKGNRYNLIANLCDTVTIGDYEYDLSYINGNKEGDCLVSINGNDVTMSLVEINDIWYVKPYNLIVSANTVNDKTYYEINKYDGVIINGEKYKRHRKYEEDVEIENYVVTDLNDSYYLEIDDILGKNNLSCKAFLPSFTLSQETETEINSYIISRIMSDDIRIDKCNKIFGVVEITPYIPFYNSNSMNENVFSSDYYFNLFSSLKLFCNVGYISIKLPIISKSGGDPIQSDIVNSKFFDKEREKAINPIIDMEKDIYYPKYINSDNGVYNGSYTDFNPISEIRVNLHFRTRNLDTWKIDESSNWFITDYYPYKDMYKDIILSQDKKELKALMEASDLVGLLGFTNNDVYYQKSKIGKSFLRFSYYDSIDPQNQTLLATSTVFMDEHSLFKKYIDNSRKNVNIYKTISETSSATTCIDKITVESEFVDEKKKSSKATTFDKKNITIDENKRLGSRLTISNKYNTDTSSEGFYIYMFKEYSKNLHPRQIFMKVDFNHAGVGLSLPFIKPMSWNKVGDNEELTPQEPLGLDSEELKDGILLEQKYAQDYIPLYAVYDFKNKEYAYVFDKRYVTVEDGIASLNLFELKLKDESGETNDTDTKTYVIDSEFE